MPSKDEIMRGIHIKPYYEEEGIVILNADSLSILPKLESQSVDLCLTDFPYGNHTDYGGELDTQDNLKILVSKSMPEILRVSQVALITTGVTNMWLYPQPKWVLSWHWTHTQSGRHCWGFSNWQPILAYGADPYLRNGKGCHQDSMGGFLSIKEKANHPCPKNLAVWEWVLLRGSVKETDFILDPFMGSGTTLIVSKKNKRQCIGIEINEQYCAEAVRRLKEAN